MKGQIHALLIRAGLYRWINTWLGGNRYAVRGSGNRLDCSGGLLTRVRVRIDGNDNRIEVGEGARLANLDILVRGDGHRLAIGAGCSIAAGKIKLEDRGSAVEIGAGTTIEDAYLGAYEGARIVLGADCMLSEAVGLRSGDMHSVLDAATGARLNPAKDIRLGDHVWLGRGVTLLKGASIGDHAVVGAQALVTGDIPAGSLAVGAPARVIRSGVTWDRRRLAITEEQKKEEGNRR